MGSKKNKAQLKTKGKITRRKKNRNNRSKRNLKRGGGVMDYLNHFWGWLTGNGKENAPTDPASVTSDTEPTMLNPDSIETNEVSENPLEPSSVESPSVNPEEVPIEPPTEEPLPEIPNNDFIEKPNEQLEPPNPITQDNTLPYQDNPIQKEEQSKPNMESASAESPMSTLGGKKRRRTRRKRKQKSTKKTG